MLRRNEVRKRTGLTLGEYFQGYSGTSNPSAAPRTWLCRLSQQKKSARSCLPIQVQPSSTATSLQKLRSFMWLIEVKIWCCVNAARSSLIVLPVYGCVWVCMGVRVRACVNVCAASGSVWFGASRPNIWQVISWEAIPSTFPPVKGCRVCRTWPKSTMRLNGQYHPSPYLPTLGFWSLRYSMSILGIQTRPPESARSAWGDYRHHKRRHD